MGYSYQPDTATCKYCGKVSTCHHMMRMYCQFDCHRLYNYFRDSIYDIQKDEHGSFVSYTLKPLNRYKKFETNLLDFREYIWNQVRPDLTMKEPLLQYKDWENYLRDNPMPKTIKSLIKKQEPLTREHMNLLKQLVEARERKGREARERKNVKKAKLEESKKKIFPENCNSNCWCQFPNHLQIALDDASIYLIENYDKKGIKYKK